MKTRTRVSKDQDEDATRSSGEPTCHRTALKDSSDIHLTSHQEKQKRHSLQSRSRRTGSKEKISRSTFEDADAGVAGCTDSSTSSLEPREVNTSDTDDLYSTIETKLSKKSGAKKSRNLDLVVRRMLKARKESEEHSTSHKADEIISETIGIKVANDSATSNFQSSANREKTTETKARNRRFSNCAYTEGMIDVQLSGECHLQKSESVVKSSSKGLQRADHHQLSQSHVLNDPCSSPDFSPGNPIPDNEGSYLKPFVQSGSAIAEERKEKDMSPIIKREPAMAMASRVSLYHRNGPQEAHSPASSFGSNPSPERRSPSPGFPESRKADTIPSPPELIMNPGINRLVSSGAGIVLTNENVNSQLPAGSVLRSCSPRPPFPQFTYSDKACGPGVTAAAMAASGIGLPTLVPPISSIPHDCPQHTMFCLNENGPSSHAEVGQYNMPDSYARPRRGAHESGGIKISPNAPTGPNPPRGIVGQKEAAAVEGRGGSRRSAVNVDEKCPYKRPPHTYPALIASAILDSPGNLITLRGIYDYIMNNFPYYKFGHDKSAWQNSIRHNLSLNQCFVKVPRYENAAKSNYWTMTREGFEEFGNENSFKRRRRRGAALAPISAYKNKKYNNNDGSRSNKSRGGNSPLCNGGKSTLANHAPWGGRSRTPEPGINYGVDRDAGTASKCLKRSCSPSGKFPGCMGGKHPRMLVLKQGEGPTLEGLSGGGDHPQRPNSLSSVEEMQGNVNSFSKSLSANTDNSAVESITSGQSANRNSPNSAKQSVTQQAWMMAAVRNNLSLFPPSILSNLTSSPPSLIPPRDRFPIEKQVTADGKSSTLGSAGNNPRPVLLDNVEIGSQSFYFDDVGSMSAWSFCCRFCEYRYVHHSPSMLEKHCQIMHQLELTNAKAKAVAAAVVGGHKKDRDGSARSPISGQVASNSASSLPSMVPGLSASMLAAAAGYSNAQNLLAAAQASGIGLTGTTLYPNSLSMPNSAATTTTHFADPLARALAQQITTAGSDTTANGEAFHRQQLAALNSALQQAAVANLTESSGVQQDQLRQLLYQQLLMQSPFFPSNTGLSSSMPRSIHGGRNDVSPLTQFWQYHQKVLEMSAQGSRNEKTNPEKEPQDRQTSLGSQSRSPDRNRRESSSSSSSRQNDPACEVEDNDKQDDIHGWKQCQDCNFTAKGAHGLELHFRKAHANSSATERKGLRLNEDDVVDGSTRPGNEHVLKEDRKVGCSPTVIANGTKSDSSTQTTNQEDKRTCQHCDVTFGDDTMYALHMTCHDRDNPFKCKICGQNCHEKYYFNVHLLRGLHQSNSSTEKRSREEGERSKNKSQRLPGVSGERRSSTSGSESEGPITDSKKLQNLDCSRPEAPLADLRDEAADPN